MLEATAPLDDAPSASPAPARFCAPGIAAVIAAAIAAWAGGAAAQTMGNNGSNFNSGYGGSGSMNGPINVGTRDSNNNQVFINGIMQAPQGSIFSNANGVSQSSTSGGVGSSGMATAIGNSLNVVVEGSWNRVSVDSTQINNGQVSANTSLNGQLHLDGP